MEITIRRFHASDDLVAITDLIHRSYARHLRRGLRYWATHQSPSDTEKRLRAGIGLLMLVDGTYGGTITVRPPESDSSVLFYRNPEVHSLGQFCIAPEFGGKGLGRRLHDYALGVARRQGAKWVALDTAKPATQLISLYESWGYRIIGECDWRPHTNYLSVVMALALVGGEADHPLWN